VLPNPGALANLLRFLRAHPEEIMKKERITREVRPRHSWARRAEQVAEALNGLRHSQSTRKI
jgi:hypothetical protein